MAKSKVLVIGSTRHEHVTSVSWGDTQSVNIVDFDVVVINCRPLTAEFLEGRPWNFFIATRKALVRLLDSGGQIIALASKWERALMDTGSSIDTYSWSPIAFGQQEESGDTIEISSKYSFPSYFARFTRWDYWFFVPQGCLTTELTDYFGSASKYAYEISIQSIAVNRYKRPLAGVIKTRIENRETKSGKDIGGILILPEIRDLDAREAVNLILIELLSQPQETLPPEWTEKISVPGILKIESEILDLKQSIERVNDQIVRLERTKASLEYFRQLLFASGTQLEKVFARCLENLGGKVAPAKYSQEEFVLQFEGSILLAECKGIAKSAALTHVRQLMDYILKYEEDEGASGKGVLLVNAWKDLAPQDRNLQDTLTFPPNVIDRATSMGIALVSSVDFFKAYCRFLSKEIDGAVILRSIVAASGVVPFE